MITGHRIGYAVYYGSEHWQVPDATTLQVLPGNFSTASEEMVADAADKAAHAAINFRNLTPNHRAEFLRCIANEIEALGDVLVHRMMQESALSEARVRSERSRTTGQLRMFADLLQEGSWVDAVIDTADPQRAPLAKPDLRRMLIPIGPVAVFSVSNFPLAYSTAGGDTASAFAAGCPVIVKAHEAHAGTNALVADAVLHAAEKTGMPDGVFSTIYAKGFDVGKWLVTHPSIKAVGFTGSVSGGRTLFDLAAARKEPIPVFAEMSSVNPVFLLPGAVKSNRDDIVKQLAASVNNGAGQFCTCPGLIIALDNADTRKCIDHLAEAFAGYPALTMLNPGIQEHYSKRKTKTLSIKGVQTEFIVADGQDGKQKGGPAIATVHAKPFLQNDVLQEEVFGPFTMFVLCTDLAEMEAVANSLHGQLTATMFGEPADSDAAARLLEVLREKAGRMIYNGVPTGVEVCPAMVHGGPYPATTDSRFTAVGSSAIRRWVRPVVYQNCPQDLLPECLKDGNPLNIWRTVNGNIGKH